MAANYWASSQRQHWQFTREKLAEIRNKLDDGDKDAVKLYPIPERRHLSIYFNIRTLSSCPPLFSTGLMICQRLSGLDGGCRYDSKL